MRTIYKDQSLRRNNTVVCSIPFTNWMYEAIELGKKYSTRDAALIMGIIRLTVLIPLPRVSESALKFVRGLHVGIAL